MTRNGNFKRRVRARAAKTGESYTAALSHIRGSDLIDPVPQIRSVRLAVAQSSPRVDPRNTAELRAGGEEMRRLMREARKAGARLIHFPEGATCSPSKRIMSTVGPDPIGPSDWSRFEWAVLREELDATRALARELELWVVVGSVHQLTWPHRPHNSLYVISDRGELATRYDERLLSNTKISFMYTPGAIPVTFEVDGLRFGLALGMEVHFPEIFDEYERLDVHCVLFSTTGGVPASDPAFAAEALGHAASNRYWVGFSVLAYGMAAPSGIAAPSGQWAAQCPVGALPSITVADIDNNPGDLARPWRRKARAGIYEPNMAKDDPRSGARNMF
ncbi:carbon-nitrogen hydrolase family protein [Rhizobium terrae]|uniref:carbon-nitrogen hydrolase family protein n=1 Tax=Rhizobium terrae TaxID=2171756 RepID=UPI000E3D3D47|nr:carbon-nitrogen hydrolase family protein [Rhizobium terrae]